MWKAIRSIKAYQPHDIDGQLLTQKRKWTTFLTKKIIINIIIVLFPIQTEPRNILSIFFHKDLYMFNSFSSFKKIK